MTQFNAYHQWLGIPLAEQPPHHYRLLGIALFEDNPLVIEHAADRQMAHLRTFETGVHATASQKLLNEVAAARVCLLNAEKKAAYDAGLRQAVTAPLAPPITTTPPVDAELRRLFHTTEQAASTARVAPLKRKRNERVRLVVGSIVLAALVALGVFVWGAIVGTRAPHSSGPAGSPSRPTDPEPIPSKSDPEPLVDPTAGPPATRLPGSPSTPAPVASPGGIEPPMTPVPDVAPPAVNADEPPDPAEGNSPEANAPSPFSDQSTSPPGFDAEEGKPAPAPAAEETHGPKGTTAKRPPPSDEARKRIAARMETIFQSSKSRTPDEQIQLAEELLARASRPGSDADERFVLFGKAAELACDGGDAALMLRAVNARADAFDVDVLAERLDMLKTFAKGAKDAGSIRSLVMEVEAVLDQAAGANRYDDAAELARGIHETCKRTQGKDFRAWAKRLHDEVQRLRKQYQIVQQAAETLKNAPDADAHLLLGRWHCFERDEWSVGLPHLRDGSDPGLQELARRELDAPPAAPDDQVALGDAWWTLAQQAKLADKDPLLRRAGYWYQTALPRVADAVKEKLNGRLKEMPEPDAPAGGLRRAALGDLLDEPNGPASPGPRPKRGRTIKCRIFAAADDEFIMCVNGEEILRGQNWTELAVKDFAFAKGDVITVRANNHAGEQGFCCVIVSEKGQVVAVTGPAWRSYQPQSQTDWANPRQMKSLNPVVGANDSSSKLVFKACGVKAMDIWGGSNPCYLAFEVR